jgi:eukaryotic-like serine/threonine-protein kinase
MDDHTKAGADLSPPEPVTTPVMSGTTHLLNPDEKTASPREERTDPACASAAADGSRFSVRRPHAQGGLGTVLVAFDCELDREVALKQIHEHRADDPSSRARFLFEAKITGSLEHPGIVPVYSLGTYVDGRPYYAMRLIKGTNLKEAVAEFHRGQGPVRDAGKRSVELRKLLRRFLDVCNAIEYAHGRGVLHRDLKPSNIMVGEYGETLVVDWGLAKSMDRADASEPSSNAGRTRTPESGPNETLPGSKIGTPEFMSPEQSKGDLDRLGPRSDVYSLGATLYFLLTGKSAFDKADRDLVLDAVRTGDFTPPAAVNPTIPRALEAICLKAMAVDPADRYTSARALADDLDRWMAGEPISARQESIPERAGRFIRRNRTATTTLAAALVVAFIGLLAILDVQRRANLELNQAMHALIDSNNRERARFDLAMETIQKFHTGVSKDFILQQKEFEPLRKTLLSEARESYGKLQALLERQPDKRSRTALGKTLADLGDLMKSVGSLEEGREAHEQALAIRRSLAQDFERDNEALADEGRSLASIGMLMNRTGELDHARKHLSDACRIFDSLVEIDPTAPTFRQELANSEKCIGDMWAETGNVDNARKSYEHARLIFERLTSEQPSDARIQKATATCLASLAVLAGKTGRPNESLELWNKTRKIRENLVRNQPDVPEFQLDLAQSHRNIGVQLAGTGEPKKALAAYQAALDLRRPLAQKNPNVTFFQRELADIHNCIGSHLASSNQIDGAIAHYKDVITILEPLVSRIPGEIELQSNLATAHNNIANLFRDSGQIAAATGSYHRALALEDKLAANHPELVDFLHVAARTRINLGDWFRSAGKPLEMLAWYQHARSILEKLEKRQPNLTPIQSDLARVYHGIGVAFSDLRQPSDAMDFYERALNVRQVLAQRDPGSTKFQSDLAASYTNIANQLASAGKLNDAIDYSRKGLQVLQKLVDADPNSAADHDNLALSQHNLANILADTGRTAEALASYGQAVSTWEALISGHPKTVSYRVRLAHCLGILGLCRLRMEQIAQGRSDLSRSLSITETLPYQDLTALYNQACFAAKLSATAPKPGTEAANAEARGYADRAMKALKGAVASGMRDPQLLRTDHDLDLLRSRPDFQALMQDVAFPANPFTR